MGHDANPASFAELLVRRHQVGVWRYLRALGCPADLADDLTQETFVTAIHKNLITLPAPAVGGFLRSTARFLFLRTRSVARRREEILVELADSAWQRDCAEDDGELWIEALRQCVESLPGRGREILTRFYRDGASRAEVAEEFRMKEAGVKTLLHRTRLVLRDCVRRRIQ
ncbi:MAG: sigma-70 family RNA polymerase sigma factor [Planctomycetes bacterium]|nr:sigma-70 family RNA polymerase sigma factor [Planctomycetota bacterium]